MKRSWIIPRTEDRRNLGQEKDTEKETEIEKNNEKEIEMEIEKEMEIGKGERK